MKRSIVIAIVIVAVVAIVSITVVMHQRGQKRKQEDTEKVAEALRQYSSGDGWNYPPPLNTATHQVNSASTKTKYK